MAGNLQKDIHNAGKGFHKYLKNPNNYSFFIKPTDKTEIIQIINSMQKENQCDQIVFLIEYFNSLNIELPSLYLK